MSHRKIKRAAGGRVKRPPLLLPSLCVKRAARIRGPFDQLATDPELFHRFPQQVNPGPLFPISCFSYLKDRVAAICRREESSVHKGGRNFPRKSAVATQAAKVTCRQPACTPSRLSPLVSSSSHTGLVGEWVPDTPRTDCSFSPPSEPLCAARQALQASASETGGGAQDLLQFQPT